MLEFEQFSVWEFSYNLYAAMFACPYCQERTDVPKAVNFWMVHAASAACEHCGKQFVIVDDTLMTEAQYQAVSPNVRLLRSAGS
jgi:hypothetical protein